ncbi:MAG: hypothetical protein JJU20_12855, partial [Opitutales bacterium]|nr:hypothetical protein [Opitutales bacterium]
MNPSKPTLNPSTSSTDIKSNPVPIPLTEAQREIWYSTQMGKAASMAYNECATLHLYGTLNLEMLKTATNELNRRHESLRSTFSPDGSCQYIADSSESELLHFDLAPIGQDTDPSLQTLIDELVWKPFDLEQGPLWQMALIQISPTHHLLALSAHHIICDGWSV